MCIDLWHAVLSLVPCQHCTVLVYSHTGTTSTTVLRLITQEADATTISLRVMKYTTVSNRLVFEGGIYIAVSGMWTEYLSNSSGMPVL